MFHLGAGGFKKGNKSDRCLHTLNLMDLENANPSGQPCLFCFLFFFFLSFLPFQDDQNDDLAEVTVTQSDATGAERQEVVAEEEEQKEGANVEEVVATQVPRDH